MMNSNKKMSKDQIIKINYNINKNTNKNNTMKNKIRNSEKKYQYLNQKSNNQLIKELNSL